MTDTTTTATWRGIEGLTAGQRQELEQYETTVGGTPAALINRARRLAAENQANIDYANIPLPAQATGTPSGWAEWDTDLWQRMFGISSCTVDCSTAQAQATAIVEVVGMQYSTGTAEGWALAEGEGLSVMNAAQARQVAQALLDAAEELDRLNGDVPPS